MPSILAAMVSAGCTVNPVPLTPAERELLGKDAHQRLFAGQDKPAEKLSLPEATARAVKYYADYRLRNLEEALNAAQLDVARFDILPRLTASAGYTTRNNDSFGFGFSPNGSVATNPSASSERTRDTLNLGLSWSVLDFGVSYYKARQQADQTLIARERRHKAVQLLAQDVRRAWYRAEAAQRLLPGVDKLLADLEIALERTRIIESRKLLPPSQVVSLRRSMLELEQQISFRRQELAQAGIELAALVNLPPGVPISLESVPPDSRKVLEITGDFGRLDAVALARRPELTEEGYKVRVSEAEARKGLLAVLPNLSLDLGLAYDSNRFLVNNTWSTAGMNIALNLVKVFSIPALNRSAEAQRQVDEARRLAVAMSILAQTRIAAVRYSLVAHEYGVWFEAARDDEEIVKLMSASAVAGVDSELELLRARARATVSAINRDLSFANLQGTVGQLFQSIGYDVVESPDEEKLTVSALGGKVGERLESFYREVFTERVDAPGLALALAPVGGVGAGQATLIAEGMSRVFSGSHVRMDDATQSAYRAELIAVLQPPRNGNQPALVTIRLRNPGGEEAPATEFKTTLSAPVDDEQLRVLGEGAAYRILLALPPARAARIGSPRLRPTMELQQGSPSASARQVNGPTSTVNPAGSATGSAPEAVVASAMPAQPAGSIAVAAVPAVPEGPVADTARVQDLVMQMAVNERSEPARMAMRVAGAAPDAGPASGDASGRAGASTLDGLPMELGIDRQLASMQRLVESGAWLPDATGLIFNQIQAAGSAGVRNQ